MLTRSRKKEAFTHVMTNVLKFEEGSPMMSAMSQLEYDLIDDIATMDKDEIMSLTYHVTNTNNTQTIKAVSTKSCKSLLHLLWWRDFLAAQRSSNGISVEEWFKLTAEGFEQFREIEAPKFTNRGDIGKVKNNTQEVTAAQVENFQKGHKRDAEAYMAWNGDGRQWFRVKRNWLSTAAADDVAELFNLLYNVPKDGTAARQLHNAKNTFLFSMLQKKVKAGQALILVREQESTLDGCKAYKAIIEYYERASTLLLVKTQCIQDLAQLKLTPRFPGGPKAFFQRFQNIYLDLENAQKKAVEDEEKIGTLNAALDDPRFEVIRTTMETLALQTHQPVVYADYMTALMTHAEKYSRDNNSGSAREVNSANRYNDNNGTSDYDDNASTSSNRSRSSANWKTDLKAYVPYHEYEKLSKEEKQQRYKAKTGGKPPTSKPRQTNNVQSEPSNVPDTVPATSSTEDISVVSAPTTTPTFREIMSMQTSLPKGTYTDQNGRQFTINMMRRQVSVSNYVANNEYDNLALSDSGANNSMAGASMRLLEQAVQPELVDVVGPSDKVHSELKGLPIGDYAGVATTSQGKQVLVIISNAIGYGKGKTIMSESQMKAYGVKCLTTPQCFGGEQKIITPDGYVFKLKLKSALTYLPIQYPSNDDIANLTRVYLTSPGTWQPDKVNDNDTDIEWFDTIQDDADEVNDDNFYDSRDGWLLPDTVLAHQDQGTLVSTLLKRTLSIANICVNGLEKATQPCDYEALRPFFGWKPVEVVKHTLAATTQYAKNVMQLPMRRHFKTRFPALRVRRLEEVYAADTFYANTKAHDGSTCAQLYCGRQSNFTYIYGMKHEHEMPGTLMDFIRRWGAMQGLKSDNAQAQTSKAVIDILRQYNIDDLHSEPHQQHQNRAEQQIQEVKAITNTVLDCTGAPSTLWLLCMTYCVYLLNHLAHQTLQWRTPIEVAFGTTPDVSALLCFSFYQPVFYFDHEAPFPESKEKLGRFVGISDNIGDALTFMIITDDTHQLIHRSVVRPANDDKNPNRRLFPKDGEEDKVEAITSFADMIDPLVRKLPTVNPDDLIGKVFLIKHDVDNSTHRAEVLKRLDHADGETEQFLVELGDGTRKDVMTYAAIVDAIDKQLTLKDNEEDTQDISTFKSITAHCKIGNTWEVLVKWDDNSETWELLRVIGKDDPITMANYAVENELLDKPGWKRFKHYVQDTRNINTLMKNTQLNAMKAVTRFKYGVQIPNSYEEAIELDKMNGNTLWADATKAKMDQIYEYGTLTSKGKVEKVPTGYTKIRVRLIYDIKQDGRRKSRLVAGGHLTGPNVDTYYSSVVSLRAMRVLVFLAELNKLKLCAGDVGNAYLEAFTNEQVCFIGGKEFQAYGHEGHMLVIVKALYGLKTSGAQFHEKFADTLRGLGYTPSRADTDLWMKDCKSHWEYVCTYVDDLLYAGKDPNAFYNALKDLGYKLKGVEEPKYHLGGDFVRVSEPESILTWGAQTYVKRMLANYEQLFGEPVPKREVHAPLEPNDHPEIDTSPLLEKHEIQAYWQMIGELQWACSLGRIDILGATITMSRFRPAPCRGHLNRLKRIYSFLRNYKKTAIKFNTEMPDYSKFNTKAPNWGHIYHPCSEEMPSNMPEPRGKPVLLSTFVDANLLHDLVTGRSCTGIIHLMNKTPIDWFSKRQNTVETATYGSEFVAARIAVDQIVELRYTLRMLGVPITGPAWMFGDNLAVVNSATMPSGKLQKRHNILSYHRVREAQASGIVNFVHIDGKHNPADILTKHTSSREWYELMKPLIFWRSRDAEHGSHRSEGSVTQSNLATKS